jgi:hypothetical protein
MGIMFTMHPTLLVGPADWDPAQSPNEVFLDRIAALWSRCDPKLAGAIVYGDARRHAELAYLTHFTPKLEPAIALIPRAGAPRLLVGGGVNMLAAARPLTWIEDLLPLRDAGPTIARWRSDLGSENLALINGDAMRFGLRQGIVAALGSPPPDMTATVAAAMRRKSARELVLIREACATLDAAVATMRAAQRGGQGMTDVVLAGEHVAHRRGAQDVRSLFGQGATLAPFQAAVPAPADPLQVYVAVRHGGYWAEGFAVLSVSDQPTAKAARLILDQAIGMARPGLPHRELAAFLARAVGPRLHSVTRGDFGRSIGLALEAPGCLNEASDECFAAGEVYTVRVGLTERDGSAIVSAMVAIGDGGPNVLWGGGTP